MKKVRLISHGSLDYSHRAVTVPRRGARQLPASPRYPDGPKADHWRCPLCGRWLPEWRPL